METVAALAAGLGLLGLGYAASPGLAKNNEGFTDSTRTVAPGADRTPRGQKTVPGKPRQASYASAGGYDLQFQIPAGG